MCAVNHVRWWGCYIPPPTMLRLHKLLLQMMASPTQQALVSTYFGLIFVQEEEDEWKKLNHVVLLTLKSRFFNCNRIFMFINQILFRDFSIWSEKLLMCLQNNKQPSCEGTLKCVIDVQSVEHFFFLECVCVGGGVSSFTPLREDHMTLQNREKQQRKTEM